MSSPSETTRFVCVAAIAAAHGVRGAMKLKHFTETPEAVAAYGPLFDERGRELFKIRVVSTVKDGVIVTAEGIGDRETAQALRGTRLYVPRDRLPHTEEDEFYLDDLVGLACFGEAGEELGRVVAVYDFGAGDVIEIRADDGRETMLPFTRTCVPVVDIAGGRLVVSEPRDDQASAEQA